MKTVGAYLLKLEAIVIEAEAETAIEETKESIVKLNRERMLDGVKSDGKEMDHYSYISQVVYGYPDSPIKLKATGAFQAAINVKVQGGFFITDSSDNKSGMLKKRYGDEIFGLDKENRIDYVKELRPKFIAQIKKALT